jgi:hypothetical protein
VEHFQVELFGNGWENRIYILVIEGATTDDIDPHRIFEIREKSSFPANLERETVELNKTPYSFRGYLAWNNLVVVKDQRYPPFLELSTIFCGIAAAMGLSTSLEDRAAGRPGILRSSRLDVYSFQQGQIVPQSPSKRSPMSLNGTGGEFPARII